MPNFLHGKNSSVLLSDSDISTWLNSASYTMTMDTAETTAFQSSARSYIPSFPGGTVSIAGMFDATAGGIDQTLNTIQTSQAASGPPVALTAAAGGLIVGQRTLIASVYDTSYTPSSPVNDVVSFAADFTYASKMGSGFVIVAKQAITTAATTTSPAGGVDFTTTGSNGGVATLHVTANTWTGNTTVTLEDSTSSGGTYAAITGGTFTVVPASTTSGQYIIIPSTTSIRRWVRASIVTAAGSGSVTVSVSVAKS